MAANTVAEKRKPKTQNKRGRGRPEVDDPKVNFTVRFSSDLVARLDAWAKKNGEVGRSVAIRQAVAKMLDGE